MPTFVEKVRKGEISNPTQKKFSIAKWEKSFIEIKDPDELDERLYSSGTWFFIQFEALRSIHRTLDVKNIDRSFLLKSICSDINRDSIIARDKFQNIVERDGGMVVDNMPSIEILENSPGIDLDALIEQIVDGATLTITEIQEKEKSGHEKDFDKIINYVLTGKNLGIFYTSLVYYWKECLWNNWFIQENEENYFIIRPKNNYEVARTVSDHREFILSSQISSFSIKNWERLNKQIRLDILKNTKIVKSIDNETGNINLTRSTDISEPPASWPLRLVAEEIYWNDILVSELPNYPGLNIRDFLGLWDILFSLGMKVEKSFTDSTEVFSNEDLIKFSFNLPKSSFLKLIQEALNIPKDLAHKVLRELTFDKDSRSELWHKPLVDLKNGELGIIYTVLCFPNMIRYVENWIKVGGLNLSTRGKLFEDYVRKNLSEAINSFRFGTNKLSVITSSKTFYTDTEYEEIDLIIIFDDIILLGEIKCHLYPTDPIEVHNTINDLEQGITQIQRKKDFFKAHFKNISSELNLPDEKNYKIIGCVITNRGLLTGFSKDGIPIVDLRIIRKYFNSDHLPLFYEIQRDSYSEKFNFYSSFSESKLNFKSYLSLPPQIMTYLMNVNRAHMRLPKIPTSPKGIVFSNLKVEIKDITLDDF